MTTVYLDPELKRKLKDVAKRARVSEAHLVREALASYLAAEQPVKLEPVGRSAEPGIAERDEEALEDFGLGRR